VHRVCRLQLAADEPGGTRFAAHYRISTCVLWRTFHDLPIRALTPSFSIHYPRFPLHTLPCSPRSFRPGSSASLCRRFLVSFAAGLSPSFRTSYAASFGASLCGSLSRSVGRSFDRCSDLSFRLCLHRCSRRSFPVSFLVSSEVSFGRCDDCCVERCVGRRTTSCTDARGMLGGKARGSAVPD
jgi:hypothetical protein